MSSEDGLCILWMSFATSQVYGTSFTRFWVSIHITTGYRTLWQHLLAERFVKPQVFICLA